MVMKVTMLDMIKANTAVFKAKLGHYMRAVKAGREVIVMDRNRPVAKLVPFEEPPATASTRTTLIPPAPGAPPFGKLKIKGIPYCGTNSLAMLQEDRRRR
jgi:prevent-host-death family protein